MSSDSKSTGGTREYQQPEATQSERRAMLKQDAQARTYFELAQGDPDAEGGPTVVGASAFGPKLPAPAWSHDPTGKEAPLGSRVDWLPDCSGIGGRDPAEWPSEFEQKPTEAEEPRDA